MKKTELLELVAKLNMRPLMVVDRETECYGERVVIAEHQVGYTIGSVDLIPELESIVDDDDRFWPVCAVRELHSWNDNYKYNVYAPSNWFTNLEEKNNERKN